MPQNRRVGAVSNVPADVVDDTRLAPAMYDEFLRAHGLRDGGASAALWQVHEDLRLIRGWRNVRVVRPSSGGCAAVKADAYVEGEAPAMYDSVHPERRRRAEAQHNTEEEKEAKGEERVEGLGKRKAQTDGEQKDYSQVVVPICADETVSPAQLNAMCSMRGKRRCVTLSVVDDDSTTTYYRVFNSLDEITHPQWKQKHGTDKRADEAFSGTAERPATAAAPADDGDGDRDDSDSDEE